MSGDHRIDRGIDHTIDHRVGVPDSARLAASAPPATSQAKPAPIGQGSARQNDVASTERAPPGFTPLSSTPHSSTPHSSTPHSSTPHSSTPNTSTPHAYTSHATTPLAVTPLAATPLAVTPHSSTPHSSTPHTSTPHTSPAQTHAPSISAPSASAAAHPPREPDAPSSHASQFGLDCRDLSLRFGRVQALAGLTLSVAPGEAVGIVGRNGAGKSTLFRCIVGAEVADAGSVHTEPNLSRLEFLARTGFVPDSLSAYDWMRAGDAIDYVAQMQPRFDRAWSLQLQALLGIDRATKIRNLSRGMEARLAFVLGLSHAPDLVLLDEPLLGVDCITHDAVLEVLARMRAENGCTMLIASHQLGDLARLTDRVAFLEKGRIVEVIDTDELTAGTVRLLVRGVPAGWRPAAISSHAASRAGANSNNLELTREGAQIIYARNDRDALMLTIRANSSEIEAAIHAQHPNARVERIELSIHEACADRLRAMEEDR